MPILLIEDDLTQKFRITSIIKHTIQEEIIHMDSVQHGIELLESDSSITLIICDYHGSSSVLIQCLKSIQKDTPCILISDLTNASLEIELPKKIRQMQNQLPLDIDRGHDSEFIKMNLAIFKLLQPMEASIYIKLSDNKYLKIFQKHDVFNEEDLLRYLRKTKSEFFYVRQNEANVALDSQNNRLADLLKSKQINPEQTRKKVATYIELMQEVITKTGFTPQVQDMAKKSVSLTLRVLGNNPKLSSILKRMRKEEGKYVPSHSVTLAEIACSLACKVEWHSSSTFLKLSLAAFLHDLPVVDDNLAQLQTTKELESRRDLSDEVVQNYKQHPLTASNFVKQFREIPSDVDTIIAQHHERPDGSGFPRGLHHNQIQPLSALFIISHDLLNFLLNKNDAKLRDFITSRSSYYSVGIFGKLFRTIQSEFLNKR